MTEGSEVSASDRPHGDDFKNHIPLEGSMSALMQQKSLKRNPPQQPGRPKKRPINASNTLSILSVRIDL